MSNRLRRNNERGFTVWVLLILLLALVLAIGAMVYKDRHSHPRTSATSGTKTFADKLGYFTVQHPATWTAGDWINNQPGSPNTLADYTEYGGFSFPDAAELSPGEKNNIEFYAYRNIGLSDALKDQFYPSNLGPSGQMKAIAINGYQALYGGNLNMAIPYSNLGAIDVYAITHNHNA